MEMLGVEIEPILGASIVDPLVVCIASGGCAKCILENKDNEGVI